MFSVERVVLTNFRSYYGTHVFELPTAAGLYNLTGRNLVNPALGANASGKSTLLDAIYWCVYGRTTRGLKAGDVVAWGERSCSVEVTLNVGGLQWVICRSQNPNMLTWAEGGLAHNTDQATIERYLRLGPEAFLYSVILPQFGASFFDLTPAAKLTLFSDIMGLDYWLERSQAAADKTKELDNEHIKAELQVAKIQGHIEAAEVDLTALGHCEFNFADEQAATVKTLGSELRSVNKELKDHEADIKYCQEVLRVNSEKIAKLKPQCICPACKQDVPNADLKELKLNKQEFIERIRKRQNQQDRDERQLDALQANIAKEANRLNPYSRMIVEKQLVLTDLKDKSSVLAAKITKLDEEHTAASFWVGGFKRVRLFIVEEALRQLEIEVNNNLASLGLMEWRIEFDVERENKSGGVTKGFVVLIYPPGAEEPVRYEAYSGGETQRLRLAGDLGLANLIMERAGLSNTIEVFDEPSKHLSQEGLLDLAETLCHRAQEQGKRILLVDHHVVDFSGFAGTITVVKDQQGSHLAE